jgi:hypothetical protein
MKFEGSFSPPIHTLCLIMTMFWDTVVQMSSTISHNLLTLLQMRDATGVVAARLLPPLLLTALATAAWSVLGCSLTTAPGVLLPAALWGIAPVPPAVQSHAHTFRLNEKLAAGIASLSTLAAFTLVPLLAGGVTLSSASGSLAPIAAALATGVTACVAAVLWTRNQTPSKSMTAGQGRVKMVFKAPPPVATTAGQVDSPAPLSSDSGAPELSQRGSEEGGREERGSGSEEPPKRASPFSDLGEWGNERLPPPQAAEAGPLRKMEWKRVARGRPFGHRLNKTRPVYAGSVGSTARMVV